MRVVATSDTHEKHSGLHVPDGDVFIHAGDFTMIGDSSWVESFNNWLGYLPHRYKIVIAGNHDRSFDLVANEGASYDLARYYGQGTLSTCTHYLLNSGCEIEGKKFWGSPYTPFFHSDYWKFHYKPNEAEAIWAKIPNKLDVLITHGPAYTHLDRTLEGDLAGCHTLFRRIRDMHLTDDQPRYHIFGHIHEAYGVDDRAADSGRTVMMNVAAVDRMYNLRNACQVFDI